MIRKLPAALRKVVEARLGDDPRALRTCTAFLAEEGHGLESLARDAKASWPLRAAAVLMLEHFAWRTKRDDPRFARNARVHRHIRGFATAPAALADFLRLSTRECRLVFARESFTAEEIARRIDDQLRHSRGLAIVGAQPDARRFLAGLGDLERALIEHLLRGESIRWVSARTPSAMNALVSCPEGTVALVIKPPGSDVEIEIKRAGTRDADPLDVVHSRNGKVVPTTHHFHGGSMESSLKWEANAGASFAKVYRQVHGCEPPISRTVALRNIFGIPSHRGELHPLEYFSDRRFRGPMREVVRQQEMEPASSAIELAAQFLGFASPAQGVIAGTSSFRLDRIARELDRGGEETGEILDEILCVYDPLDPRGNRRRANANYVEVMRQIGHFWGTLLGARGMSDGESFAARNTGLRTVWDGRRWAIRILFMDHDALRIDRTVPFGARRSMQGAARDALHVLGANGEVEMLRAIYRVSRRIESEGRARLRTAMRAAYDKTREVLNRDDAWDEHVAAYLAAKTRNAKRDWRERTAAALRTHGLREKVVEGHLAAVTTHARFLRQVAFLFT